MPKDLPERPKGDIIEDTPPEKEKVFCVNCRHSEAEPSARAWSGCVHPKNLRDSWYEPNGIQHLKPSHLNRHNNCEWYEEKNK